MLLLASKNNALLGNRYLLSLWNKKILFKTKQKKHHFSWLREAYNSLEGDNVATGELLSRAWKLKQVSGVPELTRHGLGEPTWNNSSRLQIQWPEGSL